MTMLRILLHQISVLWQLKGGIDKTFDRLTKHFLKENIDKCNLTSSKTTVEAEVSIIIVISDKKVKLLGICIDNRLTLIVMLVSSAKNCQLYNSGEKLHPLTQIFKYMNASDRNLIKNTFIMFQFSFCSLI